MRRYGAKRVPAGSSTLAFRLLTPTEQAERVKKLKASKLSDEAIAQITGLGRLEIWQILNSSP